MLIVTEMGWKSNLELHTRKNQLHDTHLMQGEFRDFELV